MAFEVVISLLLIGTGISSPVDDPIHIDLPVYDRPEVDTVLYSEEPIKTGIYPGGETLSTNTAVEDNYAKYKSQSVSNLLGNPEVNSHYEAGIFSAPISTRETVLEETEGYASKVLSFKENIQNFKAGIFQPQPIVDTISESEKYGNTGDKFYTAGKAIVGGAEGISNFINSALEVPGKIFQSITRAATEKLNNFGGKLIGL